MANAIEDLFGDLSEISKAMLEQSQPSLSISLEDIHRKSLLLAVASYFEFRLSEDVSAFCREAVGESSPVYQIIVIKAVKRQYHTWFDWDSGNANKFFSLFGKDFKRHAESEIKSNERFAQGIKDFIVLGSDRNRLVHQNFSSFSLESTPDEIMVRYRSALEFVDRVPELLATYKPASTVANALGASGAAE